MFLRRENNVYEILYAEDDIGSQNLLFEYVKSNKLPFKITTSGSFKEAVEKITKHKYDVILADYYLGDGVGIELVKHLRGVPLIIITGAGDEEVAINSIKAGAYDYLVKSPQLSHLKKLTFAVENVVRKKYLDNVLDMHSQAIQNITDGVFFIDTKNRFIYINRGFTKMYGYNENEVLGKNFGIIWEESGKSFEKFYDTKLSGEFYSVRKDKAVIPVLLTYTPIKQEYGVIIAGVGIVRDISEQKKTQFVLKKYSEHLEKLVEERTKELREKERLATIGETATMVGHDLRNPLQVLINSIFIAKLNIENSGVNRDLLTPVFNVFEDMNEQINYMNKIVSDLQYYGKNITPVIKEVNLEGFLYKIVNEQAKFDNVKYHINVDKKAMFIKCDKDLMQRVFVNLISNAHSAIKEEGNIRIKVSKNHKNYLIKITDDGIGIPEEIQKNLFKPLFTTKSKGTGLGLSVCKRIVDAHKGNIEIESAEKKGTTVKITLPEIN